MVEEIARLPYCPFTLLEVLADLGAPRKIATTLLFFILAALSFAIGGLFMKYSEGLTKWPPSLAIFACFCTGAALQALGMRRREMASSYTLVLGLEAIAAVVLGFVVLGERVTGGKLLAMALILGGVAWLEKA